MEEGNLTRRAMIRSSVGLWAAQAALGVHGQTDTALIDNIAGGYRALPVALPYSGAAIALPGFEIVHAIIKPWHALEDAFVLIEPHLASVDRPSQALCGMELRIPRQLSVSDFSAFNRPYIDRLRAWQLINDRFALVTRTNVVDALTPATAPSVHAFSYTVPTTRKGPTFCTSGSPDLDVQLRPVAEGNLSLDGMRQKLQHVARDVSARLAAIGMTWDAVTHADLCVAEPIGRLWEEVLGPLMSPATRQGVRGYHARPPILGSEVELECRCIRQEVVLGI